MQIGKIHFTDKISNHVSNHAVLCNLPFLYLHFALARFVSLHVHKECMLYVVRLLSLKSNRFSYFNNAFVIIVNIFCSLLLRFYVNNLFIENRFRRFSVP